MITKNICCIFNIGPHYRESIYKLMDEELICDFYFGDKVDSPMKLMDYNLLQGYKETVRNKRILNSGYIWQTKVWKLIFKPYNYYIITGSPYIISNWALLLLSVFSRKKIFAWTHGMKGNSSKKKKLFEKCFYGLCDKLLIYGQYSRDIMIKEGFNPNKLIPIYNSLDYESQLSIRQALKPSSIYKDHFNNDNPILIYIGRIQKSKKIDLLVHALKELEKNSIFCNLVIIGKEIDGNHISDLIENYKLSERVWLYGPCFEEEIIGQLIFNSDICISPGLIGLTSIHSLTYGTPVITSNDYSRHGPEFEAIEAGITGDFFEDDNLEDLCSKIALWINLEKSKRNQTRLNAYKIIDQKFNPYYQINILKKITKS